MTNRARISAGVAFLMAILMTPILMKLTGFAYDYVVHRDLAEVLVADLALPSPHFMLHVLVAGLDSLLPGDADTALILVLVMAYACSAVIVSNKLLDHISSPIVVLLLTFAVLVSSSAALLFPLDRQLYLGYLSPNTYHNPTIILLKPFALLSFSYAIACVNSKRAANNEFILTSALLTIACALTKPSFTICVLPALVLVAMIRRFSGAAPGWKLLTFGFVIPAVATLGIQFQLTYGASQMEGLYGGQSHIVFAPLVVMENASGGLAPKLLLSLLFPMSVVSIDFKRARESPALMLAWVLFAFGAAFTYLMAESGPRMLHGNFTWSGQITAFVLFFQSVVHLAKYFQDQVGQESPIMRQKLLVSVGILSLHTAFGIAFYLAEYISYKNFW